MKIVKIWTRIINASPNHLCKCLNLGGLEMFNTDISTSFTPGKQAIIIDSGLKLFYDSKDFIQMNLDFSVAGKDACCQVII
ncbi:MAG: hypothetical protein HUU54_04315 [Ignavibacteriaceae bacterium]|nr:hypothetical protein [Ignavibacteriaceae bacterium]